MKNANPCPKCNAHEMSRIPGGFGRVGRSVQYGPTAFTSIRISRYVCVKCGYTEEWIDDENELKKVTRNFGSIEFDDDEIANDGS